MISHKTLHHEHLEFEYKHLSWIGQPKCQRHGQQISGKTTSCNKMVKINFWDVVWVHLSVHLSVHPDKGCFSSFFFVQSPDWHKGVWCEKDFLLTKNHHLNDNDDQRTIIYFVQKTVLDWQFKNLSRITESLGPSWWIGYEIQASIDYELRVWFVVLIFEWILKSFPKQFVVL